MALGTMNQSGKQNYQVNQYIADTEADIANLPKDCAPGSSCIVVASGNVYMFNNQKKWIPFGTAGGGGGGGGTTQAIWRPING